MTRASPMALRRAVASNSLASPLLPHQGQAITARSYDYLLTEGEVWFLGAVVKLTRLSDRQQVRLNQICANIERLRP